MEPLGITLGIGAGVLGSYYYFFHKSQTKENYPPGPTPLPLIGNLLALGTKPYLALDSYGKKYGPIFSLQLGTNPAIVITDAKLMTEAFNEPNFCGKPLNKIFTVLDGGEYGVISTSGEAWTEQREFTVGFLEGLHPGTRPIDSLIQLEVDDLMNWLKLKEGTVVNLQTKLKVLALNLEWNLLSGERFEANDTKLMAMCEAATKTYDGVLSSTFVLFFPGIAKALPCFTGWNKLDDAVSGIRNLYATTVSEHEVDPNIESKPPDFVDLYLKKMKEMCSDPKSSFYGENGKKSLIANIADLHATNFGTLAAILNWSVLYLLRHPEVKDKFVKEIDSVIGPSRAPTVADKPSMPYTEALLMETLRFSSLVPMGVFHSTTTDVEFHGFKIPKDTMIIINQYSALYNVDAWGDPYNFRPERFLGEDGSTIIENEAFVPHSTGRRACIAQNFVRECLFLFLTNIYQKFELALDPKTPIPSLEPDVGLLLTPKPFNVLVKARE